MTTIKVILLTGIGVLIIGLMTYFALKDDKKDTSFGWIVMAIGVLLIFVAVIWYVIESDKKEKEVKKE